MGFWQNQIFRRVLWAVISLPLIFILFISLITLIFFPIGGGVLHLLYAYAPGGNLQSARLVFIVYAVVASLLSIMLVLMRYPLPWWWIGGIASFVCIRTWLLVCTYEGAGRAFRHQALFLTPLILLIVLPSTWYIAHLRRTT